MRPLLCFFCSLLLLLSCARSSAEDPQTVGPYQAKALTRENVLGEWVSAWAFTIGLDNRTTGKMGGFSSGAGLQMHQPVVLRSDGTMEISSETSGQPAEIALWEWDAKKQSIEVTHLDGHKDRYLVVAMDQKHLLVAWIVSSSDWPGAARLFIWFKHSTGHGLQVGAG